MSSVADKIVGTCSTTATAVGVPAAISIGNAETGLIDRADVKAVASVVTQSRRVECPVRRCEACS